MSIEVVLTAIQRQAWNAAERSEDVREKIQALFLAKECYGMKLQLLTNARVEDDAMRFATAHGVQQKKIGGAERR